MNNEVDFLFPPRIKSVATPIWFEIMMGPTLLTNLSAGFSHVNMLTANVSIFAGDRNFQTKRYMCGTSDP